MNLWHIEDALKLMLFISSDDLDFMHHFHGEIDALMKVKYDNLIEIVDWGCDHRTSSCKYKISFSNLKYGVSVGV